MASMALLSQWQATGLCSRDRSHHAAVDGICFGRPANLKADCDPTQIVIPHVIKSTLSHIERGLFVVAPVWRDRYGIG
jgi:hypothetical protein